MRPGFVAGNHDGVPLVALDLDGTLGDYHSHFLEFATNWFGRGFPDPKAINPGLRLWQFMGVSHEDYRRCKLAYRQGGLKRWMPAYPGVAQLAEEIHKLGVHLWICTTRPFDRLDNIDPDTREWLRRNDIAYEGLLFGPDKYHELDRQTRGRRTVLAVAEDLPELYADSIALGFFTLLRDQPYNRQVQAPARVHSCAEILEAVRQQHTFHEEGPFSGDRRRASAH